jgi:hypothetical protein
MTKVGNINLALSLIHNNDITPASSQNHIHDTLSLTTTSPLTADTILW